MKRKIFTFIDLFAGIGGTRIGFERAGGKCVFSSEIDKACQKTYKANFKQTPHGDITKISVETIPDFDVLVAGFPCQPFSSIGKREGFMNPQGTLFYDILRILKGKQNIKPKAFLLENVTGLLTHNNGNTFKTIINSLEDLGFKVFFKVINSKDFGLPQHRKRIYIIGFKKTLFPNIIFNFPSPSIKKSYINNYLEKNVTGYSISKHLQQTYLFKKNDGKPLVVDKNSKIQVKTLVSSYHMIQRLTGTFVKDPQTGLRLLTQDECKAIMGFNKDFIFPVSRTQMYRQIGNSVPIPVITALAKQIAKNIKSFKRTYKNNNYQNEQATIFTA